MDKDNRKLLRLEMIAVLTSWLIFFLIFIIKGEWSPVGERALAILFATSGTALVAVLVVIIAAILGKAELFVVSIVVAGFSVSASFFANFHFSFSALAVICILVGWLILKMASSETDKDKMKFAIISLSIQGLLVIVPPMLLLIFRQ